jgi:fructoselysine-6-P-deglycase FrlB-like protein
VIHTTGVSLPPAEVLARVKQFFAERVPQAAAFVEKEGPDFVVLRGQGGEEIAVRAWSDAAGKTQVRASTLFFDQALDRFFSTLPLERGVEVA